MKFTSLFSGSSGNSYLLETDNSKILIDAGKSGIKIEKELNKLNVSPNEIDAILLTHEHTDHFQSVSTLSRKYQIPVFVSLNIRNLLDFKTPDEYIHTFDPSKKFNINDINISPFQLSHDSIDPVGFSFDNNNSKISIATDTGIFNEDLINSISDSNIAVIESNYEDKLIEVSKYPYYLKRRIKSEKGHLSNKQMQELLTILSDKNVNQFILAHLSKENNQPLIVEQSAMIALENKEKKPGIYIAPREEKGITFKL